MMISESMQQALNEQIGLEFQASLKYDAMAAHFEAEGLSRLAAHYFAQANEEREHAHKFMRYLLDAGGRVQIPAIPAPPSSFPSAEAVAQAALDGEWVVTKSINRLMDLALSDSDHGTAAMLQWFVTEQVEEVSSAEHLLGLIRRAGEDNLLLVETFINESGVASE